MKLSFLTKSFIAVKMECDRNDIPYAKNQKWVPKKV